MKTLLLLRKEKNLTQKQVADILGISRQAYANYESDNREPDINTLKMLSDVFGVSIDYLLGNDEQKEPTAVADDELEEDVIIFHRDGKTQKRKFTKEQMAMFMAMVDAIPETTEDR